MTTVVIVHGAGSGGWLWRPVRTLLQAAGQEVFTPTLTGTGERAHLAGRHIDLALHIQDILGVLEYEDLQRVLLVGHSYGGMVVAGVADRAPTRLAGVVYLDAFVPGDGQALLDLVPAGMRAAFEQQVQTLPDGQQVTPPLAYAHLGRIAPDGLPDAVIQQLLARRVPHPYATYTQPVHLTNPAAVTLPHTYIHCTDKVGPDPGRGFAAQAQARGWQHRELATGHFPMLTTPRELADLIRELAAAQ